MTYHTINLSEGGAVRTLELSRPDRLNAFDQQMCDEMRDAWQVLGGDDGVRAVVLCAAGRGFCAGLDLDEATARGDRRSDERRLWSEEDPGQFLRPKVNGCWKPVIAAVNGVVAGGGFYHLFDADIVLASTDAWFTDPHVDIGLTPIVEPIGMRFRMPLGEVLRLSLGGRAVRLDAERAYAVGLVNELLAPELLIDRAVELATEIAAKSPTAVEGLLRALWGSLDQGRTAGLSFAYQLALLSNTASRREHRDAGDEGAGS